MSKIWIWACGFIDCKVEWRLYILVCCVLKRVDWFIDIKRDIMIVVYWLLMEDLRKRYVFMNWYVCEVELLKGIKIE